MKLVKGKILQNKRVAPNFYKMRLASPYLARSAKPGQFMELRCSEGLHPFLRRPFGVHRLLKNGIEFLYEVVGKGTELLAEMKEGCYVDAIGPLGEGFEIPTAAGDSVIVAGGIGVAPLVALAEALPRRSKVYVIIGAKTKARILCDKAFRFLGCQVSIITEDGSKGAKGLATDALKTLLNNRRIKHPSMIYACGSVGMLEAVWNIAKEKGVACQFSFESHMACGVGVCLGCPIKVRKGLIDFEYKMVCKDGPVFNGEDIAW